MASQTVFVANQSQSVWGQPIDAANWQSEPVLTYTVPLYIPIVLHIESSVQPTSRHGVRVHRV